MKRSITKIQQKRAELEILESLFRSVESIEKDACQRFEQTGKEQDKDWRTGELKWEDEEKTIPKMTSKWEYVPITEDDMTDEEYAKYVAVASIKAHLEKLL